MAGQVFLFRRAAWVKDAIAKLDRAVETGHPITRYCRGVALAEVPARFGRGICGDGAPVGPSAAGQLPSRPPPECTADSHARTRPSGATEAKAALERSGYVSLDPTLPQFTTDYSVTARDGLLPAATARRGGAQGPRRARLRLRRYRVRADRWGIVAIDAGTTEATARAAVGALRRHSSQPITHVVLTHAHWDHIGGLAPSQPGHPGDRPGAVRRRAADRERDGGAVPLLLRWRGSPTLRWSPTIWSMRVRP